MHAFAYDRPDSIDAAVALARDDDRVFLAGGQTLIPTLRQRLAMPDALIDLGRIAALRGIRTEPEAPPAPDAPDALVIGAGTTHAEVVESTLVRRHIPALSDLAGRIGDAQVRNRGTLGGSVANADPAADYPAAIVALGATIHTDRRTIPGDAFFLDLFTTALEPGELITAVTVPVPARAAYAKHPNPASGYAVVGVMVAQGRDGSVRVGVTGAGPCATRRPDLETALTESFSADAARSVSVPADGLNSDLHASAAYRAALIPILAARAVASLSAEGHATSV